MILVFLHGKGADKNAYDEQLKKLAKNLSADIVSFNAPFRHPTKKDKFIWFNKFEQNSRKNAKEEEYSYSLKFIKEKLQNYPLSEVVLIGHSQGGGMAISAALELNLKCAISICGDLPYNLKYKSMSKTHVYWLEGECDSYINQDRKNSYKILSDLGVNMNYYVILNCSHTKIDNAFNKIEEILARER